MKLPGGAAFALIKRASRRKAVIAAALVAMSMPQPGVTASRDASCRGLAIAHLSEQARATASKIRLKQPLTLLAIGSSSTQGAGASSVSASYPAMLRQALIEGLGYQDIMVINAGIGGENAGQTLERLERVVSDRPIDLVIWQVGTNDAIRGEDEARFRAILERGIKAVDEAGADLILLDQQFFPVMRDPVRYERFVETVAETAARHQVPVFRRYRAMQEWASRAPEQFREMLAADSFHMSDRGYACIARLIAGELIGLQTPPALARVPSGAAIRSAPLPMP